MLAHPGRRPAEQAHGAPKAATLATEITRPERAAERRRSPAPHGEAVLHLAWMTEERDDPHHEQAHGNGERDGNDE